MLPILSSQLRGVAADFANKFMQFLALLAMSLRWSSQPASKVSEGNCTKGYKKADGAAFLDVGTARSFDEGYKITPQVVGFSLMFLF
jgi:hypothetical protein